MISATAFGPMKLGWVEIWLSVNTHIVNLEYTFLFVMGFTHQINS